MKEKNKKNIRSMGKIYFYLLSIFAWSMLMKFIWGAWLLQDENGAYCEYFNRNGEHLLELIVITLLYIYMIIFVIWRALWKKRKHEKED